jgi:1-acyl-sn-glycerol-3-phosphate acyltransferase
MLDLALLDGLELRTKPPVQRLIADGFLRFDYRKIELVVEGIERIPERRVIYAMNHTDDFNYWPFQYHLHRTFERYTAAWVKGKNYEHPLVRYFMRVTNNIPLASRGYLISRDFKSAVGRRPEEQEYRLLRDALNAGAPVTEGVPRELLEKPRDMLGRPFDPSRETYVEALDALFDRMIQRFVELNRIALSIGLDLLVYPQGSRSIRLSRGHIGLGQMALHLGATIVPVGCSNGDLVYPKRSPVCKPGRIIYRIGEPITPEELAPFAVEGGFTPFSREAEAEHRERFQGVVDLTMNRIDGLVDERHRFTDSGESEGTHGTSRFI